MIRTRTLLVTTVLAVATPFAVAMAGPMGPEPMQPSPMQDHQIAEAPAAPSSMRSATDSCTPGFASMKDEYGRKYDCRGDRVR